MLVNKHDICKCQLTKCHVMWRNMTFANVRGQYVTNVKKKKKTPTWQILIKNYKKKKSPRRPRRNVSPSMFVIMCNGKSSFSFFYFTTFLFACCLVCHLLIHHHHKKDFAPIIFWWERKGKIKPKRQKPFSKNKFRNIILEGTKIFQCTHTCLRGHLWD